MMYKLKLLLGVIVVITVATQCWASDTEITTHEFGTEMPATISEATIDIEIVFSFSVTSMRDEEWFSVVPTHFDVVQNYPSPFIATPTTGFDLPEESGLFATLYDNLRSHIRILENNTRSPGSYEAEWDNMTDFGQPAANGVFFFLLLTDDNYAIRRMLLLK